MGTQPVVGFQYAVPTLRALPTKVNEPPTMRLFGMGPAPSGSATIMACTSALAPAKPC